MRTGLLRVAAGALVVVAALALPAPGGAQGAPSGVALPASVPLFPLRDVALFPDTTQELYVFEPRYRALVADALAGDRIIGTVLLRPGFEADYEGTPPVYAVGCAGLITRAAENDDGTWNIAIVGLSRFRITGEDRSGTYRVADVEPLPEAGAGGSLMLQRQRIESLLAGLGGALPPPVLPDELVVNMLARSLGSAPADRQALLELDGPAARAEAVIAWLEEQEQAGR